ncbi:hypothetical protein FKW77_008268 [Venturia effusa]|uniref:Uncharacterized protein n=1 Tax=Venturia effusa TaxID=50376 RepID=A0A517KZV2_9PEZI|nr:hypothetical protein FKW77_008268 [Venturia effusa]
MAASTARISFGNETNVLEFAPYSAEHLLSYSKNAEAKLKALADGSSTSSETSGLIGQDAVFFDTCEGVVPVISGMKTVLQWMLKHPSKGYPAAYKGRKLLTVEIAEALHGGPIPFVGLLRIQEALLLLDLKGHLGGQFVIRKAIVQHINTKILTPNEFHKIGLIFSHAPTSDINLVQLAVNKTLDFMDASLADGTLTQDGYDAYWRVSEAVSILAEKIDKARAGKQNRLAREAQKAARAAKRQAALQEKHTVQNLQHAYQQSAKSHKLMKAAKILRELEDADQGKRSISEAAVSKLMVGPVVIKTRMTKAD